MIRVLLIARYRHPTMWRKVEAMAAYPDIQIRTIAPARWKDAFLTAHQMDARYPRDERIALPMWGPLTDPHRGIYRTLTFGMRAFRPHIVHAEEEPDSLAALQVALARQLFAPRAALVLHTWQNLDRVKRQAVRAVIRISLAAADAVCCANQEAVELLQRWGYTRPTPLIPAMGVDTETFRPCTPPSSGFHIGYVGRLVPEKGVDTLLDAVALLLRQRPSAPVSLTIVGSGPYEPALRERAARVHLQPRIQFLGGMTPEWVAQVLCGLHVLVLPSRTTPVWKEQLGRVLLEAMASGVPVIGSDSGAIPEVIGDAGLLFPEGDAEALADSLALLLQDRRLWNDLRRRGLARAQEYSQAALAERTRAFYSELLAIRRRHPRAV